MRLNRKAQYAVLFALYLNRSGKANVETAAKNLNVSPSFLFHIANSMRRAKLLVSERGPTGGYSINPGVTVGQVLTAVGTAPFIKKTETQRLVRGGAEHRALAGFVGKLSVATAKAFVTRISDMNSTLVTDELRQLDSANEVRGLA